MIRQPSRSTLFPYTPPFRSSRGSEPLLSLPPYPMHSPGFSPGSEQHLKISPRQSSTASASLRGSSCWRLLLSRTSRSDCSPASETLLSLPPYPMHSRGFSPGSEQYLRLSPHQSSSPRSAPRRAPEVR